MNRCCIGAIAICSISLGIPRSHARGRAGHERITEGTVAHLPQPLRAYVQFNLDTIRTISGGEPPGTHYIDIDFYPEFFAGTFPRDINDLIALYGENVVQQNGTVPWTIGDFVEELSGMMASATTVQDWADLRYTAAALAHYIEDLHNPLHLTLNFNGQLTGNFGIHRRYESQMIQWNLENLNITPAPDKCIYWLSPVDTIFDGIDIHYWLVDNIMESDDVHRGNPAVYGDSYYEGLWEDTGGFTQVLYQEASQSVASAWYTAWINAGSPDPLYELGLDDFALFEACFTGPNGGPIDPGCEGADFDVDGDIDCDDFDTFLLFWSVPDPPPSLVACGPLVPAASTWSLLVMAILLVGSGACIWRRGRDRGSLG